MATITEPIDEPRLPPELEAEIFAFAAYRDRQTAITLLCVSKRVRDCVIPILYRVVNFQDTAQLVQFPLYADHYAEQIQHLLVVAGVALSDEPSLSFLSKCKRLSNVAIWTSDFPDQLMSIIQTLPLQKLSLCISRWFPSHNSTPKTWDFTSFPHLTHLELVGTVEKWEGVMELADLPNLTHLNFNVPYYEGVVTSSLTHCKKLEVLLLTSLSSPPPELQFDDDRIVYLQVKDWEDEWLEGGKLGDREGDWWTRAEEVIAERRNPKLISEPLDSSSLLCDGISAVRIE